MLTPFPAQPTNLKTKKNIFVGPQVYVFMGGVMGRNLRHIGTPGHFQKYAAYSVFQNLYTVQVFKSRT